MIYDTAKLIKLSEIISPARKKLFDANKVFALLQIFTLFLRKIPVLIRKIV